MHNLSEDVESIYIFQLLTHAHQLMQRFDIEYYDSETGEIILLYTALDYLHPPILTLNNHLEVQDGDYIRLTTTYNNTTITGNFTSLKITDNIYIYLILLLHM